MSSANKNQAPAKKSIGDLFKTGEIKTGRAVMDQLQQKAADLDTFKKAAEDEMRHRRVRAK